jgi:Domain of unknown function (DUF1929)/Glyoxal oxidase N-terminus
MVISSRSPRSFKYLIPLLMVISALPTIGNAQDQPHNPFVSPSEMRHKTRMRLVAQASPNLNGRWDTVPFHMPINPVHAALMNTGKVLIISGSGNDPDNTNLQAAVWDPKTLLIKTFAISWDMFCSGMVILPDGRPFVLGGTLKYDPFLGETKTAIFDPVSETFVGSPDMGVNQGRWYPSGIVLGNGSVLVYSGFKNTLGTTGNSVTNFDMQIWNGTAWTPAGTSFPSLELYPRQHLLPNGKIFESGANQDSQMYDPATKTFSFVANTIFTKNREYGTSVLLPLTPENHFKPVVIIMGGSASMTTDTTELMDLSVAPLKWVKGPNMVQPRIQMNATILPNGKVLASGGSVKDEDVTTAVKRAEIYDPSLNVFTPAGSMDVARVYHSNTMLLPDGRVAAFGGNPQRKQYESEIEIYSPNYLFDGSGNPAKRPTIIGVPPGGLRYGEEFIVQTPNADSIKSVVLIRASAVTHAFDMDQRLVGLTFSIGTGELKATAPANGNLAPPGYYLLFILNKAGVPSVASFVRVSSGSPTHLTENRRAGDFDRVNLNVTASQGPKTQQMNAALADGRDPVKTDLANLGVESRDFKIHQVDNAHARALMAATVEAPLGPLADFVGKWRGLGFNSIFRPSQQAVSGSDNVLELNLTNESLEFMPSLGSIPNRGEVQPDIFLNGLPYIQKISDVTTPNLAVGIHFEPGVWLRIPPTTNPTVPTPSLARMASIPHGATILTQGTSKSAAGGPTILSVDMTPFQTGTTNKIHFPSQTASDQGTPRIPKVLPVPGTTLTTADWQALLDDPNSLLRNASGSQTILKTTIISVATAPPNPLFGGGTRDIAFLLGKPAPNANAADMAATFWIETVRINLDIPAMEAGSSVTLSPKTAVPGLPMPQFQVHSASAISAPKTMPVSYTQIQYSQTVMLVFNGLTWPHVSVATLVPAATVTVSLP